MGRRAKKKKYIYINQRTNTNKHWPNQYDDADVSHEGVLAAFYFHKAVNIAYMKIDQTDGEHDSNLGVCLLLTYSTEQSPS